MRKSVNLLALAVAGVGLSCSSVSAQLGLSWDELGPNNQGNHTRALAVDGSGNVWAGSVGGGLWKSTDGGSTWEQSGITENLAVSSIAVDGNTLYVGTGESFFYEPATTFINGWHYDSVSTWKSGFFGFAGQPGEGVFVSNDGGATWTHNNATWSPSSVPYTGVFKSIQKIAAKGGRVLVGALDGLYVSDDQLATATKAGGTNAFRSNPIVDVDFLGGGVVLAATKDSVYRSTDNGSNFGAAINSSIPTGTTAPNNRVGGDRIEFAVAPSNDNIVYVTGASGINGNCTGVWRSDDAGVTWTRIAPFESASFQPFQGTGVYNLVLAVQKNDPNAVVLGGKRLYKYSQANGWVTTASHIYTPGFSTNYVPATQLSIAVDPNSDSTYYIGTDAEIVRTTNFGRTFSFKTKSYNNAHLSSVHGSPKWEVLVGDRYNGVLYKDNANSSSNLQQFTQLTNESNGGVARWCPTLLDHIVSQGDVTGLVRSFTVGTSFETFYGLPLYPIHPSFGVNADSMWVDRPDTSSGGGTLYDVGGVTVAPWAWDEYIPAANLGDDTLIQNTPLYLYLATRNFVWVCTNPFGSIDSLPNWNRLTVDITRTSFGNNKREFITALTVSNDASHTVWVGTNDGRIFRINNANDPVNRDVTTATLQVDDPSMPRRWVTDIAVDAGNNGIVAVTYGAYASGDDRVWITNNGMDAVPTWRSAQANLPANLPVYSIAFHPQGGRYATVIGTDRGVYGSNTDYSNTGNTFNWSEESVGIGRVPVTDISYRRYYAEWIDANNYKYSPDYTLFIATAGRGAFKSTNLVSTEERGFELSGIKMELSPNPATVLSNINIDLPSATRVKLEAFDLQGNRVAVLGDRMWGAGKLEVEFNTANLPAGIYLVKGQFVNGKGEFHQTLKQVVVK